MKTHRATLCPWCGEPIRRLFCSNPPCLIRNAWGTRYLESAHNLTTAQLVSWARVQRLLEPVPERMTR